MPVTYSTITVRPSASRLGRRAPVTPEPPKPEAKATPSATRHYAIPPFQAPISQPPNQNQPIDVQPSPFPATLPSVTSSPILSIKTSQDKMQEETWGPEITLKPASEAAKKGKSSKEQRQKDKYRRHMKMCPTNGYQPRKDGSKPGDDAQKLQRALSGSTERITTYTLEKLVGGGKRKTWVTYSRVVTVVEEKAVDKDGNAVAKEEKKDTKNEESGSDNSDEEEVSESSDEEYFDEKRCEWRPKSEIRKKGNLGSRTKSGITTIIGAGTACEKVVTAGVLHPI